jgi:hypothetical protein
VADSVAEPFDRGFVEDQPYGGFRQLFAIAQEHAALAEEPYRTNRNRALVGIRQEAANEIGGKSQKLSSLPRISARNPLATLSKKGGF